MAIDLSKKRIIMIHGLAPKPPEKDLHALWSKCLIENIRIDDKPLAKALEATPGVFRSAYWANATPSHIEDDATYVKKLRVQVDKVIDERRQAREGFHVGAGERIGAFFKSRGLDLANMLSSALRVKDDVVTGYLREVELYDQDQYIADKIRAPLEEDLRAAWTDGCEVAILAHSMGTFIAYDVLWRFSHRNVPGYREHRNRRVRLFNTLGSPLGDDLIRDLLFARHHENKGKRAYPTNIDAWHNYSCLGDVVSFQENFDEVFFQEMRKLGVLPKQPGHRARNYVKLHNPFQVVSHAGNKGKEKRNPHKSYGYLVQPRLGSWMADFLHGRLT